MRLSDQIEHVLILAHFYMVWHILFFERGLILASLEFLSLIGLHLVVPIDRLFAQES